MSQLVVRPGRNAARQAKRLKEIRKVKGAIMWHERERKKRQELFQERHESKQAAILRVKWQYENVTKLKREALRRAMEDWQLGPLRPNRAIGNDEHKYGTITSRQVQKPDIPVHTQRNRNEVRIKKGLDPEYPLVVDDKKYFHIVKKDRVVVIRGREKGKIGVVQEITKETHHATVKGINLQYHPSDLFNSTNDDGDKRENEVSIPLEDLRLVVPYEIVQNGQRAFGDVIVEKVFMERHTTGVDPFTGTDYGDNEIPKDHQYDPQTGLPIFHRYIAGTKNRIEWPWEIEQETEEIGVAKDDKAESQTWLRKTLSSIRHPIKKIKSLTSKDNETTASGKGEQHLVDQQLEEVETSVKTQLRERPRSQNVVLPEAYDETDTTRNIVEGADSMAYTLIAPPFPDTLGEELRENISEFSTEKNKEIAKDGTGARRIKPKRMTTQGIVAREAARKRHAASQRMKTPMQLRWEAEQAKKLRQQKTAPLVTTKDLMAALGQYMQQTKTLKHSKRATIADELD